MLTHVVLLWHLLLPEVILIFLLLVLTGAMAWLPLSILGMSHSLAAKWLSTMGPVVLLGRYGSAEVRAE